jgi:hypothetical protein
MYYFVVPKRSHDDRPIPLFRVFSNERKEARHSPAPEESLYHISRYQIPFLCLECAIILLIIEEDVWRCWRQDLVFRIETPLSHACRQGIQISGLPSFNTAREYFLIRQRYHPHGVPSFRVIKHVKVPSMELNHRSQFNPHVGFPR